MPRNRSTYRWSDRINLGSEIIIIYKANTLADVHRHIMAIFSVAIEAAVQGPREARYFVYWELVYRTKQHRLAIVPRNWSLVIDLLFT